MVVSMVDALTYAGVFKPMTPKQRRAALRKVDETVGRIAAEQAEIDATEQRIFADARIGADWWPEHWRINPTKLIVPPALVHQAREVLLRAEAHRAPLHRLRYRWSLRRRAPAWKQAKVRRRWSLATRVLREGMRFNKAIVAARIIEREMAGARVLNEAFE